MKRPDGRLCRWLIKIETKNPINKAMEGIYFLGILKNTLTTCVEIITIGTAMTASQKFVCIVGKSIFAPPFRNYY